MQQPATHSAPLCASAMSAQPSRAAAPVIACLLGAGLLLAGCTSIDAMPRKDIAMARLMMADGTPAGTALLTAQGEQITLSVTATGLTPGAHGLHLHQTGQCRQPDFTSAGGHLNPESKDHGTLSQGGAHLGDLPNITIKESGSGSMMAQISASRTQATEWLFDADGTAVVIHAGPDDYRTNPAGAAGPRVACGVLSRLS